MERYRAQFTAMACENTIEVYAASSDLANRALAAAVAEVKRIEAKYSRYRDDSVVTAINRNAGIAPVGIDAETALLLDFADACYAQSDGLFDITSGVLRRVWNFKLARVPTGDELATVLPLIAWSKVQRTGGDQPSVYLPAAGMELDFGGFGKEYAADRAAATLLAHGIHHGFVELGGDVVVTGPQADGTPWQLAIRHPRKPDAAIATLPIASGAIATSGDYERFVEIDGIRHCHLLNPVTGQSVRGLQSATVFASSCVVAGMLASIAMLRGAAGASWLAGSGAGAILVDANGGLVRLGDVTAQD